METDRVRRRLYEILEDEDVHDIPSKLFNASILSLISLNVLAVMLETVDGFANRWHSQLWFFELFSVAVFTLEYALRLWVSTLRPGYDGVVSGRIRYGLRPMALIDLVAILPFYLPMVFAFDLRFVRALRLFRLLRLFKMGRYSRALSLIVQVLRAKKAELGVAAFAASIFFCIVSAFMYHLENNAQPQAFCNIFATMWWTVSALTPLSSGLAPVTHGGRILAGFVAFGGVALFALPAGILASGFSKALAKDEEPTRVCPRCGLKL